MQTLLRCVVPPCLPKAALSRGVQHASPLVKHATLTLLQRALDTLAAALRDVRAAEAAAAAAGQQQGLAAQWAALGAALRQAARARLPDLQPLLALFAALEREGLAGANELLLGALRRVRRGWAACLPGALAEGRVDVGRLLPQDPLALKPVHQLQFMELLLSAAEAAPGQDGAGVGGSAEQQQQEQQQAAAVATLTAAQLLPALRLLVGAGAAEVRAAAYHWLLGRLHATTVFGANPDEAALWLDWLPTR